MLHFTHQQVVNFCREASDVTILEFLMFIKQPETGLKEKKYAKVLGDRK